MIWESSDWKALLIKYVAKIERFTYKQFSYEGEKYDNTEEFFNKLELYLDKLLLFTAVICRKLYEQEKLSTKAERKKIKITRCNTNDDNHRLKSCYKIDDHEEPFMG
jgi:hypothetical protein